jgi:hypothetical protein
VLLKKLQLFVCLTALGGCASALEPGQSADQVFAARGAPQFRIAVDGAERWIYQRAFAQENLTLEFDSRARLLRHYNGLSDENFARAQVGIWGHKEVTAAFGPPTERSFVGWAEHQFEVWSYRYRQGSGAPMFMGMHFGKDGKLAKFYAYPDPAFDPGERTRE